MDSMPTFMESFEMSELLEEHFENVQMSALEVERQTTEIVDFFKFRNKKDGGVVDDPLESGTCNIRNLLEFIIRVQKKLRLSKIQQENLEISLKVSDIIPDLIKGDETKISKILTNVISNAVKYTEEGLVAIYVTKSERLGVSYLDFVCVDTGIGMSKETLARLFKPYVKNDTNKESFCIGLIITKCIVERMGGRLKISSKGEGLGTTARISFPLIEAKKNAKESIPKKKKKEEEEEVEGEIEEEEDEEENHVTKLTDVIIVEDNYINRRVFEHQAKKYLHIEQKARNTRIWVFENGQEALEHIMKRKMLYYIRTPIIITDIDMPVVNGIDLCRCIRKIFGSEIPVHCVTAAMVNEPDKFMREHQFDSYRSKPVSFSQMKDDIRNLARMRFNRMKNQMSTKYNVRPISSQSQNL